MYIYTFDVKVRPYVYLNEEKQVWMIKHEIVATLFYILGKQLKPNFPRWDIYEVLKVLLYYSPVCCTHSPFSPFDSLLFSHCCVQNKERLRIDMTLFTPSLSPPLSPFSSFSHSHTQTHTHSHTHSDTDTHKTHTDTHTQTFSVCLSITPSLSF